MRRPKGAPPERTLAAGVPEEPDLGLAGARPSEPRLTASASAAYNLMVIDSGEKCAERRFIDFLTGKSLRLTAQRRAIIETVFSTRQHFTADELLNWSRQRDKSVSRATVYRTLPLLTESGLVRELDLGKEYKFYDPNYAEHPSHNHIICEDCQKIIEFDSPKLERLQAAVAQRLGFSATGHRLQIMARCDELKKHGTCKRAGE